MRRVKLEGLQGSGFYEEGMRPLLRCWSAKEDGKRNHRGGRRCGS